MSGVILNGLTLQESDFLSHVQMWGSASYPVQKIGSRWQWVEFWGIKGAPTTYKTKKAAVAAVEAYVNILLDKHAGRLEPSPGATFKAVANG